MRRKGGGKDSPRNPTHENDYKHKYRYLNEINFYFRMDKQRNTLKKYKIKQKVSKMVLLFTLYWATSYERHLIPPDCDRIQPPPGNGEGCGKDLKISS